MGGGGLHEWESNREHRFKLRKVEAGWLKEGRQEDDWTRILMAVLRSTAREAVVM